MLILSLKLCHLAKKKMIADVTEINKTKGMDDTKAKQEAERFAADLESQKPYQTKVIELLNGIKHNTNNGN